MNGRGKIWTWFTSPLRWAVALVAIGLLIGSLLWLPVIRKRLGDDMAVKVTPSPAGPSQTVTSSPSTSQTPLSPTPSVRSSEGSSTSNTLLTFTLLPGNARQGKTIRTMIKLSGNGERIRFNLAMDANAYDAYYALLQTTGGQPIWLSPSLKSLRGSQGELLVQVIVPARLLPDGNYTFLLSGSKKGQRSKDPISEYVFKVIHD